MSISAVDYVNISIKYVNISINYTKIFYDTRAIFPHNTYFSSKLTIRTASLKGLPGMNTLAYRTHSCVMKKIKCCEYGLCFCIHNTSFFRMLWMAQKARMFATGKPFQQYMMQLSSLFSPFINYEENEVLRIRSCSLEPTF